MSTSTFYFDKFDGRRPRAPVTPGALVMGLWQFFATLAVVRDERDAGGHVALGTSILS